MRTRFCTRRSKIQRLHERLRLEGRSHGNAIVNGMLDFQLDIAIELVERDRWPTWIELGADLERRTTTPSHMPLWNKISWASITWKEGNEPWSPF